MNQHTKGIRWLCGGLIALNLLFIWGNSALLGSTSQEISDSVLGVLKLLRTILGPNAGTVIRKLAHFGEFACLGMLMSWFWQLMDRTCSRIPLAALCGLLTACVDETIQVFVPGRASSLLDVWLDLLGVTAGMIVLIFGQYLYGKRKKQTEF